MALDGVVLLFLSSPGLLELRDVASRPKVAVQLRLTPSKVETFMQAIQAVATLLDGFPETFNYSRDPDDAHYVNLALAANASLIVSRDKDLLDLMDPASTTGCDFQKRFPQLRILSPVAFLQEIEVP